MHDAANLDAILALVFWLFMGGLALAVLGSWWLGVRLYFTQLRETTDASQPTDDHARR
jgi:hypothetical protein